MKLNKFQIIGLLLLIWFYTNSGGGLVRPPFTPDLSAADLESKVLAGMLVLADDHPVPVVAKQLPLPPIPTEEVEPVVVEEVSDPKEIELFPGRYPRAIVLTDTVNCVPCINYDKNTINVFRKPDWQKQGWSIGSETTNMIEIVDLSKDENKFYEYFEKLADFRDTISPATPTTVFLSADGTVKDIKIGSISHGEFVKLSKQDNINTSYLDIMSYEDMIRLHNKFHGGGNWKWPGDLKTHLAVTHGVK